MGTTEVSAFVSATIDLTQEGVGRVPNGHRRLQYKRLVRAGRIQETSHNQRGDCFIKSIVAKETTYCPVAKIGYSSFMCGQSIKSVSP